MKKIKFLVTAVLICSICLSLCACGISKRNAVGTWTDTYEFDGNEFSVTLVLSENGQYNMVTYKNGSLNSTLEGRWEIDGGDVCCYTEGGSRTYEYKNNTLVNGAQHLKKS